MSKTASKRIESEVKIPSCSLGLVLDVGVFFLAADEDLLLLLTRCSPLQFIYGRVVEREIKSDTSLLRISLPLMPEQEEEKETERLQENLSKLFAQPLHPKVLVPPPPKPPNRSRSSDLAQD